MGMLFADVLLEMPAAASPAMVISCWTVWRRLGFLQKFAHLTALSRAIARAALEMVYGVDTEDADE